MQKAIAIGVLGLGTIFLAILLTGCSDTENPAPTAGTVSDSSTTSQPGVTPEPTTRSATALTDQDELEEIPVGGSVEGTIEENFERDRFFFQAEEGTEYLIEAVWETFRGISLSLTESNNEEFSIKGRESARQPLRWEWTAPWSGKFELEVGSTDHTEDEWRGSYTVFISIYIGPLSAPMNVQATVVEGKTVRVSWDPVEGADYYNVYAYNHEFNDPTCSLNSFGKPRGCEDLATNVTGTTYVDTTPDPVNKNYYWVTACKPRECSEIDSDNPVVAPGISSTGPQPVPTPTTTPSATAVPQSTPTSSSPTDRERFEDDTPPGYTAVALSDDGRVWGSPTKYTTDSDPGAVAYMLLGKLMGCNFANLEADRQSTVHIRVEQLGRLSGYESETVCRVTSKSWNAWDGLRITHIRFFDESNEGGVREHEVAYSGEPDSPTPTPTPTPSATPAPTPTTMQSATPTETTSECAQRDKDVLVALYDAADGENWRRRGNWLTDEPLGEWYGVTTSDEGCVTRLELWRNGITGEIPAQLGSLSELTVLNLRDNPLSGQIPSEIGNLLNLELLDLSDQDGQLDPINALSGEIPAELGNLTNLRVLRLSFQRLSGHMPTQLGSLPNLESLKLDQNELSGEIPSALGNLATLERLYLTGNELSGEIPSALGSLAMLKWLDLSYNQLSGGIPPALGNLAMLERLDLADNQLSGEIPSALGNLAMLEVMDLTDNQLSGEIPSALGNLAMLEVMDLKYNQLSGEIPPALGNLAMLERLDLRDNQLSGLPDELVGLAALERLYLGENPYEGCIPAELRYEWGKNDFEKFGDAVEDRLRDWFSFRARQDASDLEELDIPWCSVLPPADPALLEAITRNNPDQLRSLIASGAAANTAAPDGDPLLASAIFYDRTEIAEILVDAGADVNAKTAFGNPLLASAIFWNRTEIVQILVDGGADVNAKTHGGSSLLSTAIWWDRTDIVQLLIDAGAEE